MHELSLAESMLEIVENAAAKAGVGAVRRVRLSIGALAHVDSDALAYCCEIVSRGGVAASARFEIDRPDGRAQCHSCKKTFLLSDLTTKCGNCGASDFEILDGEQMRVVEIGF